MTEIAYVYAMDVITIHMITIRTQTNSLRRIGRPLMSKRMVLRDAMKPIVLHDRKVKYTP